MKKLLLNWLMRKVYGEKLTVAILRYAIIYNEGDAQFITDVKPIRSPLGDLYYITVSCVHPRRSIDKPIFKFKYSIKDQDPAPKVERQNPDRVKVHNVENSEYIKYS